MGGEEVRVHQCEVCELGSEAAHLVRELPSEVIAHLGVSELVEEQLVVPPTDRVLEPGLAEAADVEGQAPPSEPGTVGFRDLGDDAGVDVSPDEFPGEVLGVLDEPSLPRRVLRGVDDPLGAAVGIVLDAGRFDLAGRRGKASRANVLPLDRKSTRLNSSHIQKSRMPSSA